MSVINTSRQIFSPPKLQGPEEISFKSAVHSLRLQRIARIAKAVFFTLSSLAITFSLALIEASVITWPLTIPFFLFSIVCGFAFYRLNSLDQRYVEALNAKTRESLAKKELELVFLDHNHIPAKEIEKKLKDINRVLGSEVFDQRAIDHITSLKIEPQQGPKSLADAAAEQNKPIAFSYDVAWTEEGRYGWPSFEYSLRLNWSGKSAEPIELAYTSAEKAK